MDFIALLDRLMIKGSTTTLIAYPIGRVIFDHTAETKCQSCIPWPSSLPSCSYCLSFPIYLYISLQDDLTLANTSF